MSATPSDLRARLAELPPAQRRRFRRRLDGATRVQATAKRRRILARIGADLDVELTRRRLRQANLPDRLTYPDLPISERRDELAAAIREHQVVVVAGETGSGKSTQLPKICLELGRGVDGLIGHTQPRRIAARTIAERIAAETGTTVGGLVGYTVRFSDHVGDGTLVKVMTDGILLAEIGSDPDLAAYDTIILDEAHERSLNIDFLLGYLRRLLPRRPDLKVVVTSATIDTERFSAHFGGAPVVEVSGRTYPVEIRYRPLDGDGEPRDQPQGICDAVVELFAEGDGDVLVFCSGEREIRDAAEALARLDLPHTEIVPLYARLSAREQHRVFAPHTGRRIVVATNVAETSLTVPGIRYVVDAGTARISRYGRRSKVQRLPIEPISRASADQRAGRCGRLGPGICIRLYSADDYESRPEFTDPEIQRTNVASVVLAMAARGLGDIEDFPFLDPPDRRQVTDGIALLEELGAVRAGKRGDRDWLTPTGRALAQLPVDLRLGRMILEAAATGCLREVLVIAAGLSIQDPRERPHDQAERADRLHRRFVDPRSDFLTWLALWDHIRGERRARTSAGFRRLCRDEFLNYRRVREWQDVHSQLRQAAHDLGLFQNREPATPETIHRAILAGLVSHIGVRDPDSHEYRGARGVRFALHPGSGLFTRNPEWVMAAELVETGRLWARQVAPIDPAWVEETAPHLVRRTHSDPFWDPDEGASFVAETVTVYGLRIVAGRRVRHARVDPAGAREMFIRHALVGGDWTADYDFVAVNRARIAEVEEMEARRRQGGLLVDDERLFALFDARIPDEVVSARHFDAWWRTERRRRPHLLDLDLADLVDDDSATPDDEAFPTVWRLGELELNLAYEFDPTSPTDGLTVELSLGGLHRVDPAAFDWLVPGLRTELITALLRTMPKPLRKRFAPLPDTARALAERLGPDDGDLVAALRRELTRLGGVAVPADAFDPTRLPPHLRPGFRVVDDEGNLVASGDDLAALRRELADAARAVPAPRLHHLERSGITTWDVGELPRVVEVGEPPAPRFAYPALVDDGDSVSLRLCPGVDAQYDAHWDGVRRLLRLALPSNPGRGLRELLTVEATAAVRAGPHGTPAEWIEDCVTAALDALMVEAGGVVWDGVAFDRLVDRVRGGVADTTEAVGRDSLAVLAEFRRVQVAAARNAALDRHPGVLADVSAQVADLVFPGFVTALGARRLPDVARYLRAVVYRLERFARNPARDAAAMATVQALEAEFDRLRDAVGPSTRLADVAWMLQELRVSLFAQPVGAKGPVSEQRIRRALAAAVDT